MNVSNNVTQARYERRNFVSKDGYEVSIHSGHWKLNKDSAFYTDSLPECLDCNLNRYFRQVLAVYGETCSAIHTENLFRHFKKYFEYIEGSVGLELLSPESFMSYRDKMVRTEYVLAPMRSFIRSWVSLGYPGIPSETLTMLEKWKIKGNEKGYAVQSMCPESGPFSDIEMDGIVSGVLDCYAAGRLDLRDTCYAMILAMTGRRPIQLSSLKLQDLIASGERYFIKFPRAKQRYGVWRGSFAKFEIVEDLWVLLQIQAKAVKSAFKDQLGKEIAAKLVSELPLFPAMAKYSVSKSLKEQLDGDFLHARVDEVNTSMRKVKEVIGVISHRTGAITHLNAYRFRYTLGTNLAREGRGEYIIAEALDHSDIQNAGVYVKNIPEIVERIDKAVALQLAPLAQAFQGFLVADETTARRGADRSSRICGSGGNVGTCGSYGFCAALAPVACYTCSHFQPWLDGPHELVLDELIRERDSVRDITGDLKVASANDRLILAVSDVVARCKVMQSDLSNV